MFTEEPEELLSIPAPGDIMPSVDTQAGETLGSVARLAEYRLVRGRSRYIVDVEEVDECQRLCSDGLGDLWERDELR